MILSHVPASPDPPFLQIKFIYVCVTVSVVPKLILSVQDLNNVPTAAHISSAKIERIVKHRAIIYKAGALIIP